LRLQDISALVQYAVLNKIKPLALASSVGLTPEIRSTEDAAYTGSARLAIHLPLSGVLNLGAAMTMYNVVSFPMT
jgi:hypothetical protein